MKAKTQIQFLVCLVLLTAVGGAAVSARYTAAEYGRANARIAVLGAGSQYISVTQPIISPELKHETITLEIANYEGDDVSDVALDYTVDYHTTGNLPLTFQASVSGVAGTSTGNSCSGHFNSGSTKQTQTMTIQIFWASTAGSLDAKYENRTDAVLIRLNAVQSDN